MICQLSCSQQNIHPAIYRSILENIARKRKNIYQKKKNLHKDRYVIIRHHKKAASAIYRQRPLDISLCADG